MTRSGVSAILGARVVMAMVVVTGIGVPCPVGVWAQDASSLAGRWTLNRELSQFPEVGFGADWLSAGRQAADAPSGGGGRGRRGGGGGGGGGAAGGMGAGGFTGPRESIDDARRKTQLTAEVRNPSAHLTIVDTATAVTIAGDGGLTRTFHPDGRDEVLQLDGVPVEVNAKRDAGRLVVVYRVEQGRELRYTYSRTASPAQLVVEVQFIERGGGDTVKRVYEPTKESEAPATGTGAGAGAGIAAAASALAASGVAGAGAGGQAPAAPGAPGAAGSRPAEPFNQQPDAEFKGLTTLGIVVEDQNPQASACGLGKDRLEAAISKRFSDAGFKVRRNSDDDTYIYANVITTSPSAGLCVSRYDLFLYTQTTARLSYGETSVLVQVSLLHKGGITGGAAAGHADDILRRVGEYADQFSTRIRNANASK